MIAQKMRKTTYFCYFHISLKNCVEELLKTKIGGKEQMANENSIH